MSTHKNLKSIYCGRFTRQGKSASLTKVIFLVMYQSTLQKTQETETEITRNQEFKRHSKTSNKKHTRISNLPQCIIQPMLSTKHSVHFHSLTNSELIKKKKKNNLFVTPGSKQIHSNWDSIHQLAN